jgi:hypothetical protein
MFAVCYNYHKPEGDWPAFSKLLKRLIRDLIRRRGGRDSRSAR